MSEMQFGNGETIAMSALVMATMMPDPSARPVNSSDCSYPITADLDYLLTSGGRVLAAGTGQTKAMSGKRLWFESKESLPIGALAEITLNWPVRLDDKVPLKLRILGRTIRAEANCTAVEILRHEFRIGRVSQSRPYRPSVLAPPSRTIRASA